MKKRLVLYPMLALSLALVVTGCAPAKKEGEKKLSVTTEAVAQVPTQEMKTYVSKAGFSVAYPAEWHLEENRGAGWRIGPLGPAFNLYDPKNEKIGMFFQMENEDIILDNIDNSRDIDDIPVKIDERMLFIIKDKTMMRLIENVRTFSKNDIKYYEVYGVPQGLTGKQYVTFFYSKNNINIIQIDSGQNNIEEALEIMKIEVFNE